MTRCPPTHEFDLVPDSGVIPVDEATWIRVQYPLLEFLPARRVARLEKPARIHVVAYGEPGDHMPAAIVARLETLCGTQLWQAACGLERRSCPPP